MGAKVDLQTLSPKSMGTPEVSHLNPRGCDPLKRGKKTTQPVFQSLFLRKNKQIKLKKKTVYVDDDQTPRVNKGTPNHHESRRKRKTKKRKALTRPCFLCGSWKKTKGWEWLLVAFGRLKELMFKNSRCFNRSEPMDAYANKRMLLNIVCLEKRVEERENASQSHLVAWFQGMSFSSAVRLGCPLAYNHNLVMHQMPLWISPKAFLDMDIPPLKCTSWGWGGLGLDPTLSIV